MRHSVFNIILATLLPVSFFTACKKSSSDPQPSGSNSNSVNVTFLKVGASSIYNYKDFAYTDTIYSVVEKEIAQDTFLVRNYTSIPYIVPSEYFVLSGNTLSYSYRMRDPGSYQILCKFNQPVGTTWTALQDNVINYTATIDSVNAVVPSGIGMLTNVVKVKYVDAYGNTTYQYFSPTVGIIGVGYSTATLYLKKNTTGTTVSNAPSKMPAITFGNFPFLTVGNIWKYALQEGGIADTLVVTVASKNAQNIYTINLLDQASGTPVINYWYEDNGYLVAYQTGEQIVQGDPIYENPSIAKLNDGWVGLSGSTTYCYRITSLDSNTTSAQYGLQACMAINVNSGLLSNQTNYWNASKGEVHVDGISFTQDLYNSNVRTSSSASKKPFILGLTF